MPPDNPDRDRKIADTNWGIKPDDQPANAAEAAGRALPTYRYDPAEPDVVKKILRAQRQGFNTANRVRIEPATAGRPGRTLIMDINKDAFVIEGLSFGDDNLIALLQNLGAAFDPQDLKSLTPDPTTIREYALSRAWAWGAERASG
jgi:hypothetical protein